MKLIKLNTDIRLLFKHFSITWERQHSHYKPGIVLNWVNKSGNSRGKRILRFPRFPLFS